MTRTLSLCAILLLSACAASEAERRAAAAPLPWCDPCTSPCTSPCAKPVVAAPVAPPAPAPAPAYVPPPPTPASAPTFDPAPGDYPAAQTVALATSTPGATIHYTTDGSEPTTASPVYSGPIRVEQATTIRALAVAPNAPASAVSAGAYGITPPPPPARVVVTAKKLELKEKIFFDTSKATIKPVSFELLDEAAQVLNAHPEVKKLTIEGHTDSTGAAAANQALSQARAEAVRDYLVKKGVAADRLSAKGYGATRPIGENATAAGREANRRVELMIE
jgi:outer membrane protein OmpA-like peptidoglycan-associated protein